MNDAYGDDITDGEYLTTDEYGAYELHTTEDKARAEAERVARNFNTTRKVYRLVEVGSVTGEKAVRWTNKREAAKAKR